MTKKELELILKIFSEENVRQNIKKLYKKTQYTLESNSANLLSYSSNIENKNPNIIELNLSKLLKADKIKYSLDYDVVVVEIAKLKIVEGQRKLHLIEDYVIKKVDKIDLLSCSAVEERKTIKLYKDVLVGNEAIIFGYPTSIGLKELPQINYLRPLLRKGVIAGKNDNLKTIILDSATHYGNSGGPVIEIEHISITKTKYRIIGLIGQFVPFVEKWINKTLRYQQVEISNSGYTVVIPMDFVLELINKFNIEDNNSI